MNFQESFTTAIEALRANRVRTGLTMLGVIIGVTSVILLVAVGQGASDYVTNQIKGLGSDLLFILPGGRGGGATVMKFRLADARALERRGTAIGKVAGMVNGSATARHRSRRMKVPVQGVTASYRDLRELELGAGAFFTDADADGRRRVVVIGSEVAEELFGTESALGQKIKVDDMSFRVVGVMQEEGKSFGQNPDERVYIPVTVAQDLFQIEGITQMLATPRPNVPVEQAEREITKILKQRLGGREDFSVHSQSALLKTFGTITGALKYTLGAIAGISLLVGGIGIMNIMLVSVRERTREIGIRKAVGARKADILMQFLIEAVTLSLVGGMIGIGLGSTGAEIAHKAYPLLPTRTTLWSIILAFLFSFAVGIFFGVYPAKKAADLDPIDALRYE